MIGGQRIFSEYRFERFTNPSHRPCRWSLRVLFPETLSGRGNRSQTCDKKGGPLKKDALTPVSLFSIAIIFIAYSLKYKIGSLNAPGVSFFPIVSAAGLAGLSLVLFWKDMRSAKKERQSQVIHESVLESIQGGKLYALIAVMVLFALLHSVLGFWLCVFAAMVAFQRIAGVSTWRWSLLGGGATMAIGYLVFEHWMGAHFPVGVFEIIRSWLN